MATLQEITGSIDVHSPILKSRSKMADQRDPRGFPILNIWRPLRSQISVLNDLTYIMPAMHEQCLLWPFDVHSLILKSRSKMADLREITGFPILNIWRPFNSQISGVFDLSWTCLLMNNVCNGPLMYIASFWNPGPRWPTCGKLRDFPYLTYGDLSTARSQEWVTRAESAYSGTMHEMVHWWT